MKENHTSCQLPIAEAISAAGTGWAESMTNSSGRVGAGGVGGMPVSTVAFTPYTAVKREGPDPKTWPFSVALISFTQAEGGQAAGGGMLPPLSH